jgi:hypothetical protein
MPIPATITIDLADRIAVAQLAAVLLALAATAEKSPAGFTAPSGPAEPKPKRTKADKPADKPADAPKQETIPEVTKASPTVAPEGATAGTPTAATQPDPTQSGADELRAALLAVIQNPKLGPPKAGEILSKHGAKNASAVTADKRPAVIADLKAALEGAK